MRVGEEELVTYSPRESTYFKPRKSMTGEEVSGRALRLVNLMIDEFSKKNEIKRVVLSREIALIAFPP